MSILASKTLYAHWSGEGFQQKNSDLFRRAIEVDLRIPSIEYSCTCRSPMTPAREYRKLVRKIRRGYSYTCHEIVPCSLILHMMQHLQKLEF